ncbi:hypothetical protein KIPB_012494, partial [Kipferlia bialata]
VAPIDRELLVATLFGRIFLAKHVEAQLHEGRVNGPYTQQSATKPVSLLRNPNSVTEASEDRSVLPPQVPFSPFPASLSQAPSGQGRVDPPLPSVSHMEARAVSEARPPVGKRERERESDREYSRLPPSLPRGLLPITVPPDQSVSQAYRHQDGMNTPRPADRDRQDDLSASKASLGAARPVTSASRSGTSVITLDPAPDGMDDEYGAILSPPTAGMVPQMQATREPAVQTPQDMRDRRVVASLAEPILVHKYMRGRDSFHLRQFWLSAPLMANHQVLAVSWDAPERGGRLTAPAAAVERRTLIIEAIQEGPGSAEMGDSITKRRGSLTGLMPGGDLGALCLTLEGVLGTDPAVSASARREVVSVVFASQTDFDAWVAGLKQLSGAE